MFDTRHRTKQRPLSRLCTQQKTRKSRCNPAIGKGCASNVSLEAPMKRTQMLRTMLLAVVLVATVSLARIAGQPPTLDDSLGKWGSTERYDGEPRISIAFRRAPDLLKVGPSCSVRRGTVTTTP